jgi:hypothetical protein
MSGCRECCTDDTLGDTLTVEVREEVDMMEVWWYKCERSRWSAERSAARTLQEKGAMRADLLSSVGLSDGGAVGGGVYGVIGIRYLLGRHVKRRDGMKWKERQMDAKRGLTFI